MRIFAMMTDLRPRVALKCSEPGCDKPHQARGYCTNHYRTKRRAGFISKLPHWPEAGKPLAFIEAHVKFDGPDCLIWPFAKRGCSGRGALRFRGGFVVPARAMCLLAHGEPPTDEHAAAHSCGNGHAGCVNPRHLSWKDRLGNNIDTVLHRTEAFRDAAGKLHMTARQAVEIANDPRTAKVLAPIYGCSEMTIYDIRRGRTWSAATGIRRAA